MQLGNLATEERLATIRRHLDTAGAVRISPLAAELGVSDMTIRRDLQELEAMGLVRRVRGGALAVGPVAFADRHKERARAKAKVAAKLLPLVPDGGPIGIDASSTLLRLAAGLTGRDLTVITNGPETFQALQDRPGVTATLTGGELDKRTGSLVGPIACRCAGYLLLRRFFTSAAGVDAELGESEPSLDEAEVKRAMAAVADEVVLAVDATKLRVRSLAVGLEWSQIDVLVTDLDPADKRLDPYRSLVTEIL
ncbi:MAG TPA: DeoR/GlpR family DNA-binding transcription regulator [Acidimicrobiales bacterium]|nr:DeoR/GlpR family DNA-binding transcription regulator [Acidimicrobiales bacterium]